MNEDEKMRNAQAALKCVCVLSLAIELCVCVALCEAHFALHTSPVCVFVW